MNYLLKSSALIVLLTLPLVAGSITTTFGQNDGASGAMFNLVVGPESLIVDGLSLLDNSTTDLTLNVYIKTGTYVGFATDPSAWTLVSATDVSTGNGASTPTNVSVTPFRLAAGTTYGVYVTFTMTSNPPNMLYTRGNNTYSNGDVSLTAGEGISGLFGSKAVFAGRTWDGTIDYTLASATPEPSSLALIAFLAPGLLLLRRRYLRRY